MTPLLALIPAFPAAGFLINASLGRRLPKAVSGWLASLAMLASFVVAVVLVRQVAALGEETRFIQQTLWSWISSGDLQLDLALRLDRKSTRLNSSHMSESRMPSSA